jgi:hypothetical protein
MADCTNVSANLVECVSNQPIIWIGCLTYGGYLELYTKWSKSATISETDQWN